MRRFMLWASCLGLGWIAGVAAELTPVGSHAGTLEFRTPRPVSYVLEEQPLTLLSVKTVQHWVGARRVGAPTNQPVQLGSRLVLRLQPGTDPVALLQGSPVKLDREITPGLYILQASNVWSGLDEARRIADLPGVVACYPLTRRKLPRQSRYALAPNDTYFDRQWNLENRDPQTGLSLGADLNVRAAWPLTRGAGVTVAVGDDGVEVTHPDLARALDGSPSFNFETREASGLHGASFQDHGTCVAGMIAAQAGNRRGLSGVAPEAKLASWVIYTKGDFLVDDELLMEMFQYKSNVVAVQNHSWANASDAQYDVEPLQKIGISNAVHSGRGGLGVILTRAAGNGREDANNANDDGYNADPLSISVGAARLDGRAATYSNPGACVLVAGPSSDTEAGFPTVPSTDRLGRLGFNRGVYETDLADYAIDDSGFTGTSAAAPQIAGVAALILSANPRLGYRDVQHILALSARHVDLADPDLGTNGAGLRVSHNVGFGIPDAGEATRLARTWTNRPALVSLRYSSTAYTNIPDDSLHVLISGPGVPANLATISASPSSGPHADQPTANFPLVHLGLATNEITENLAGKLALIRRGGDPADTNAFFINKLRKAARAGAAGAIVYNNRDTTTRILMGDTDFAPLPAVFISQSAGEALTNLIAGKTNIQARLAPDPAVYAFAVNDTLLCEHVQLRLETDHTRRSDLRITLVSPQGTRSVLQHVTADRSPGPVDWTYMSTHHFLESSAGTWTVNVLDEGVDGIGGVRGVTLILNGTRIKDTDRDGLDDDWEQRYFGTLAHGPLDDPDGDGYNNAREQVMGTDPSKAEIPFVADLSPLNDHLARLSWPSRPGTQYEVWSGSGLLQLTPGAPVSAGFPETEWIFPSTNAASQFFRVRAVPATP